MGINFCAYDVTGFLDASIGSFISEIEDIAIEMCKLDDYEERLKLLEDIQYVIIQCNNVLR